MAVQISASARLCGEAARFFQAPYFSALTTVGGDGAPHSSMIWVRRDGGDVLMVTVRGRQKWRDMTHDPRVTLLAHDPGNPYHYVEIRGTVTMTDEGGAELMNELCLAYTGKLWEPDPSQEARVVVRLTPSKVIEANVPR
ncbi:PPOX class F420-dependent oxidoreductase [Amycolatopsis sp. NPDC059027]|uniref:PPOX class F420-dependent oxidoreductase n=1 Tax=unclassified Amycolatopsis TaxID=2618356 RepID=UPI0036721F97